MSWLCASLIIYILFTVLSGCGSRKKETYFDQEKAIMDSVSKHSSVNLKVDTSKTKKQTHLVQSDSSVEELTIYPHAGVPINFKFNLPDLLSGRGYAVSGQIDSIKHKIKQRTQKTVDQTETKQVGKSQDTRKNASTDLKKQATKKTGGKVVQTEGMAWWIYLIIGLAIIIAIALAYLKYCKIFPFNIKLPLV